MKRNVDRMRYQSDSAAFWLCILGICFNIAYFIGIYSNRLLTPDASVGLDVLYNIVFMLIAFLTSEKTKAYARPWAFAAAGLGAAQVLRIEWLPKKFLEAELLAESGYRLAVLLLCASGAALLLAGAVCLIHATMLKRHMAALGNNGAAGEGR